jgi:hypothetical protein
MLKTVFVGVLVSLIITGVADARVAGASNPHKHLHGCVDGMVKVTCACRAASGQYQVCKAGQWCHAVFGVCHQ